ncbi:phosphatase 2C-like domain-containing protein [Geopyxis carbonaria]|nr:phosphatase 2C-like domain-containing protein [Geopyxis carbonaria]
MHAAVVAGRRAGCEIGPLRSLGGPHQQRRWFRDYFTAHLPGSSLHPDRPLPKQDDSKRDLLASAFFTRQMFPSEAHVFSQSLDRNTTTVRIPLRSAKHHFGATRARGTRPNNEDNYQAGVIDVPLFSPIATSPVEDHQPGQEPSVFYFSVFDGHGGDLASLYLKDYLHRYIEETSKLFNPGNEQRPLADPDSVHVDHDAEGWAERTKLQQDLVNLWQNTVGGYFRRFKPDFGVTKGCGVSGDGRIGAVLTYALLKLDMDFITNQRPWFIPSDATPTQVDSEESTNSFKGGSTATVILISTSTPKPFWNPKQKSTLITAHLGDTRALLCRTSDGEAVPITTNHHPSSPIESGRLRRYAASFVQDSFGEERFGFLANTRSVGDVKQKRLGVSAEPDLHVTDIAPAEYSFLVLVSDGISGVLDDQEIVDIVKECRTPEEAAKELTEFVDEVGESGDNATAIVVRMGGWEKRNEGGEGWLGTKKQREWRRENAEEYGTRGRRM